MTGEQMAAFMRITQSAAVRGRIAEDTPEGWEFIIGGLPYNDCVEALKRFVTRPNPEGKRGPWINAVDIYEEVRKVRERRTEGTDVSFLGSKWYPKQLEGESDASHARREIEAKRAYVKAIADGEPEPEPPMLEERFRPDQLAGIFQSVPQIAPAARTRLPGASVPLSPRSKALMRAMLEREGS